MRVGIVTTTYPRYKGDPAGVFISDLADALRELGHVVRVVAPEPWDSQDVTRSEDLVRVPIQPRFAGRIAYGSGIVENLKRSPLLVLGIPGFIRSMEEATRRWLGQCEVIDACFTAAGIAVARARHSSQAIVYTGHGSDIHLLDKSRLYQTYFRRLLSRYDRVSVVSSYLAGKLRAYRCCDDPLVIGNGVSTAVQEYAGDWRTLPTVIYASRLIRSKRPMLLITAWAEVVKRIPEAKLIVFGRGPLDHPLRRLGDSLGLKDCIEFRGHTPLERVWQEMGRGWLTVLPSLGEGFNLGLVESLAVGTPFLSSPVGAGPEIAEQTGGGRILPEPLSSKVLADSIISMLSDREGTRVMGARGRQTVMELYSWKSVAARKAELYASAVESVRSRA